MTDRYARQIRLPQIGAAGQARIDAATVCLIGCGALGTGLSEMLARAGVGRIRIADRDFVERSNLQRQVLFDEDDADKRLPKAEAARTKLQAINRNIQVEALVTDVVPRNILDIIEGATVVLDGTDNLETRYLLNDACLKREIPWVYGGAVGMSGLVLPIVPGKGPCLRCLLPDPPPLGTLPTCDTAGVLAATTRTVSSLQFSAALQLVLGDFAGVGRLTRLDVWTRHFSTVTIPKDDACPACARHHYEFLSAKNTAWTTTLCGRNAVQVTPQTETTLDLAAMQDRLTSLGQVTDNGFLLTLRLDNLEIVLFPDGRAVVQGTTDEARARTVLAQVLAG